MKRATIENGVTVWRDENGVCEPPPNRMDWTCGNAPHVETDKTAMYHGVYDPGLGVRLRGRDHRRQVMREKGLIEVG